jgi:hypothetical protein
VIDLEEVHLALRAILSAVAELPTLRAWENVDFTPSATQPSVSEEMGQSSDRLLSGTAANGTVETTGLYVVKLFGIAGRGDADIREIVTAIKTAFPIGAGTTALDSVDTLRIEGDAGYDVSQILSIGHGKSQCTLTIPWLAYWRNAAVLSLTA